jgi:hypothetical protein
VAADGLEQTARALENMDDGIGNVAVARMELRA